MSKVFSQLNEELYTKWWEDIILWFIPGFVNCDSGHCFLYKRWRGRIYVIKELKPLT